MQAIIYDTSGADAGRLRLVERPDPVPQAGEVCVRVAVSGVNPTDWKARAGVRPRAWPHQIPNQDGAGTIESVGLGVDRSRVGQRVWVYHAADERPAGTAAELVCVPENQAVALPGDISFAQGASLGIPAMTAHRCLFADGPVAGLQVLVTGGAGAVGQAAIQLARRGGAEVIATVSSQEKASIAVEAGAHVVLNYREPSFADELAHAAAVGLDRVVDVDMAANMAGYLEHLNPYAVAACYASGASPLSTPLSPLMRSNALLRFVRIYGVPQPDLDAAVSDITAALQEGALRPLPWHRFPLAQTSEAHDACREGAVGKVLVDVAAPEAR